MGGGPHRRAPQGRACRDRRALGPTRVSCGDASRALTEAWLSGDSFAVAVEAICSLAVCVPTAGTGYTRRRAAGKRARGTTARASRCFTATRSGARTRHIRPATNRQGEAKVRSSEPQGQSFGGGSQASLPANSRPSADRGADPRSVSLSRYRKISSRRCPVRLAGSPPSIGRVGSLGPSEGARRGIRPFGQIRSSSHEFRPCEVEPRERFELSTPALRRRCSAADEGLAVRRTTRRAIADSGRAPKRRHN